MEYRKSMIIIILIIFLTGITCVCASDVNDTVVAHDDGDAAVLSQDDETNDGLITTGSNDNFETVEDDNQVIGEAGDEEMIGKTFQDLDSDIDLVHDSTIAVGENNAVNADIHVSEYNSQSNVVTNSNFYTFFDGNGNLLNAVTYDELIFRGEFSNLPNHLVINQPVTITGDDAVLNDVGFVISSENVVLNKLVLVAAAPLGDLIKVAASNVDLINLNITYIVNGSGKAIAVEGDNVNISNNSIYFDGHGMDFESMVINIYDVEKVSLDGNNITAKIPVLYEYIDYSFSMRFATCSLQLFDALDIELTNNNFNLFVDSVDGGYEVGVLYIQSSDVLVRGNNFNVIDANSHYPDSIGIYAIECIICDEASFIENNFNISTTGRKSNDCIVNVLDVGGSNAVIIGNNITCDCNCPVRGIVSSNGYALSEYLTIHDNFCNVTGYAIVENNQYGHVSGIEIESGPATVYNNTVYAQNKVGYNGACPVTGISVFFPPSSSLSLDVQNNTFYTNGKYAVDISYPTNGAIVVGNTLFAHELKGDDAVFISSGGNNVVKNNFPLKSLYDVKITADVVWLGSDAIVNVSVFNATGSVTIEVNGKSYDVELADSVATKVIPCDNLAAGENIITATYLTPESVFKNDTAILYVADGVITNNTLKYYFNDYGYMSSFIPNGATLDFQGLFFGTYPIFIDRSVNMISTTCDALFGSGDYSGVHMRINEGCDYTNVTGLKFINSFLDIIGSYHVTFDNVSMLSDTNGRENYLMHIRSSNNAVIKNSYFESGGLQRYLFYLDTLHDILFDNNVFNITGSCDTVISSNTLLSLSYKPQYVSYTNNIFYSNNSASSGYAITVCGSGNLVENNTFYFNGPGILNKYAETSTGNVYRNNTIYGDASFHPTANSLVENNRIYGAGEVIITTGTVAINNAFSKSAISGSNITFANNNVRSAVTVNGDNNRIEGNIIVSTDYHAVNLDLATKNNVTDNYLVASELIGDSAVKFIDENNLVANNRPYKVTIDVDSFVEDSPITIYINIFGNFTGPVPVSVVNSISGTGQIIQIEASNGRGVKNLNLSNGTYHASLDITEGGYLSEASKDFVVLSKTLFIALNAKINDAEDICILNWDYLYDENVDSGLANGIVIDKNLTIFGQGHVIDANGRARIFNVGEDVSLTIINLTLKNANAIDGGAIYIGSKSSVDIVNSSLLDNNAQNGGGIWNGGILKIINSKMADNTARYSGGAVYNDAGGSVNLINSIFENNVATDYGGAIYSKDSLQLTNSSFICNNALNGGAIYNRNKLDVTNSIFKCNNATNGSAIWTYSAKNVEINDTKFIDNDIFVYLPNVFYLDKSGCEFLSELKFEIIHIDDFISESNITINVVEITRANEFNGSVIVSIGDEEYVIDIINGSGSKTVAPNVPFGKYAAELTFIKTKEYDSATAQSNQFQVSVNPKITLEIPDFEKGSSATVHITANPLFTDEVNITIDGVNYSVNVINGTANVTITPIIDLGTYVAVINYAGNENYTRATVESNNFTVKPLPADNSKIVMKQASVLYTGKYSVTVYGKDGNPAKGDNVVFYIGGKKIKTVKTNDKGVATFNLPKKYVPKMYTIKATALGKSQSRKIVIKQILTLKKVKVKRSAKKLVLTATLKKVDGKLLKGKKIIFKFKAKKYTAKTNKRGVAKVIINKKVLKKLKVGKKVTYKAIYLKTTVKIIAKIKK